jgi:YhcN/YlaJ family sporulation lipoprotein
MHAMQNVNFKRLFLLGALVLVMGVAVSGCMNRAEEGIVEPAPSPDYMPRASAGAPDPAARPAARYDWMKEAAQVEARIAAISEISEARVVVAENTALVGVKFDRTYRGDMTERIREMVAAEVMKADPEITTVAVTADADDVEDIYEISDRTLAGREMDTLKDDINEIVRNATTLR